MLLVNYFKIMLYLFSIYNILSIAILYWQKDIKLFFLHIGVAVFLIVNLLGVIFVRLLGFQGVDIILYGYAMPFVLLMLNIFIWNKSYSTLRFQKKYEKENNAKLREIISKSGSFENKTLHDIANAA